MNTSEVKLSIFQILEKENDPRILEAIREVVLSIMKLSKGKELSNGDEAGAVVIHSGDGQPLTKKHMEKVVSDARHSVQAGHFVKQETLTKEVENW